MHTLDTKAARDLLGVSKEDDAATVRAAWLKLVRSYHPDQAKSDPVAANRRLAEINAGFDILSAAAAAPEPAAGVIDANAAKTTVRRQRPAADMVRTRHTTQATAANTNHLPAVKEEKEAPAKTWSASDQAYADAFNSARRIFDRPASHARHVAYA